MAKNNTDWTEEKCKRFIKEGRGQGEGKEYKPWVTIQDFPTMGRATRVFGWKTQRIHHLLSDLQLRYFYQLEWESSIIDIREHYPLLDLQENIGIESDLGDFKDRKTKVPHILSTTFLVARYNTKEQIQYVARALRNSSQLEKKTTLKRLEAERRYWHLKGIDWGIVTNKDINITRVKNIEWLHQIGSDGGLTTNQNLELAEGLLARFAGNHQPIRKIVVEFEEDYYLDQGSGISLLKRLLIEKKIGVNMDKPINLNAEGKSLVPLK